MKARQQEQCAAIRTLDDDLTAVVAGGMINLDRHTVPPQDTGHSAIPVPYAETDGSMRYGAGPWDYGYGSPTGPWPA